MPIQKGEENKPPEGKKVSVRAARLEDSPEKSVLPPGAKDFASIYRDARGKLGSMGTIERSDPNRKKKIIGWIVVVVLVLAGVSIGGFYYFMNTEDSFSDDNIEISVLRSPALSSGDSTGFTITVKNTAAIALRNVELTVRYPEEFRFNSSSPLADNAANNAWTLGEIPAGGSESVEVTGQLFGSVGSTIGFSSLLSYMPANFNSEFQKREDFNVIIASSVLNFDVNAPARVISENPEQYSYTITNNSSEPIDRIRFHLTIPDDFATSDFNPAPTDGTATWEIARLDPAGSYTVSFNGTVTAAEGSMREVKAAVGYVDADGTYHEQMAETSIVFVINPELTVELDAVTVSEYGTVPFGGSLDYTLSYNNASQSVINNLVLAVEFNDTVLNWESLVDTNGGAVSENTIQWDSSEVSGLESVKPGDSGELKFSINLLENIVAKDTDERNYSVQATAYARSDDVVDLEGGVFEVVSEPVEVKVSSRLDLRAEGRYYSDEYIAVGDGPIPPVVGETTTYQIYWYIQNGTNEVDEVTVTATLPDDVVWEEDSSISAGELSYDESTRAITWSINRILAHVGQLSPELSCRFAISVTPDASDSGTLMTLLGKSTISGHDSFAGHGVEGVEDLITSNLESDPQAVGQGLVTSGSTANTNSGTNANTNLSSNTNSAVNTNSPGGY